MEKKRWNKLGFEVSHVGFGAWGIGGSKVGNTTVIESDAAILAYLEKGGNFIDTAPTYGDSEAHICKVLKEFKTTDPVYICTKTKFGETMDTVCEIRKSCEKSLTNLGRDCIDVFYLHMPPEDDEVIDAALSELESLRKEGKIKAIGASIKGPAVTEKTSALCKKYIDSKRIDVIELVYSILRQKNYDIMQYARKNNVEIVARTVLESGLLTGKYGKGYRFEESDHRSRWNPAMDDIAEYVKRIQDDYTDAQFPTSAALALGFALKEESISSIILGAKNPDQVNRNFEMLKIGELSDERYEILRRDFSGINDKCNPA